jgi:di/tricarboxylate transporter
MLPRQLVKLPVCTGTLSAARNFSRASATPEAPAAARKALAELGPLSREEWITAIAFVLMVTG